MITFPAIWWLFPAACLLLILFSLYLTRSGGLENALLQKGFVALGALNDDKGTVQNSASWVLPYGLAGAMLADLTLAGKVEPAGPRRVARRIAMARGLPPRRRSWRRLAKVDGTR